MSTPLGNVAKVCELAAKEGITAVFLLSRTYSLVAMEVVLGSVNDTLPEYIKISDNVIKLHGVAVLQGEAKP